MTEHVENRSWSNEIKERIKSADLDAILLFYSELNKKWTIDKTNIIQTVQRACKNFNISEVSKYWIDRNFNNIKTEKILELELEKLKSIFNKKITKDFFEININEDDEINEKHIIDNFDYIVI